LTIYKTRAEVDIIVERKGRLHALEIRSRKTVAGDYLSGLERFARIAGTASGGAGIRWRRRTETQRGDHPRLARDRRGGEADPRLMRGDHADPECNTFGRLALLACAEIASFAKSETHLLAVAGMPSSMFLTEGIQQLRQKGFSVAGHLAVGEPVEEICRLAAELKCDLIVVGHKQKASFGSRWWRGSVGKTLLDHAPCSIFVALTGD